MDGDRVIDCDECLVYAEGSWLPYHTRDLVSYSIDYVFAEVEEQLAMHPKGATEPRSIFARASDRLQKFVPYIGLIGAGILVVWALLTG